MGCKLDGQRITCVDFMLNQVCLSKLVVVHCKHISRSSVLLSSVYWLMAAIAKEQICSNSSSHVRVRFVSAVTRAVFLPLFRFDQDRILLPSHKDVRAWGLQVYRQIASLQHCFLSPSSTA